MNTNRSRLEDSAENLIRAATDAFSDEDEEFFAACEARWASAFAPEGPTLRELIELALSRTAPAPDSASGDRGLHDQR